MVGPDEQWLGLERAIRRLLEQVPPAVRPHFPFFHATDLINGYRQHVDWTEDDRYQLLEALLALPRQHRAAVSVAWCHRVGNPQLDHVMAFAEAVIGAARYLEQRAPAEIAHVIAEDCREMREPLRKVPGILRGDDVPPEWVARATTARVKDGVMFCTKLDAPLLQLADACAWAFRRYVRKQKHGDRVMRALAGSLFTARRIDLAQEAGHAVFHWAPLPWL